MSIIVSAVRSHGQIALPSLSISQSRELRHPPSPPPLPFLLSHSPIPLMLWPLFSPWAMSGALPAIAVGAKLPQFCTFYTAREKRG